MHSRYTVHAYVVGVKKCCMINHTSTLNVLYYQHFLWSVYIWKHVSKNNIASWKLLQSSLRAWNLVHECPQPQYQLRNKILQAKGKYKQLWAKKTSVKMWTDTGFNWEQKSLCKGTPHYSGHQAPCHTFMCTSKIVQKLFIRKSESPFQMTFLPFLQLI